MAKDNLTDLLRQLDVQSTHEKHAQVEETCKQLLDKGCTNPGSILKQYLIALIKQDKYSAALNGLRIYKSIDERYASQTRLEKLYIYYKLGNIKLFEQLYSTIITDDIDNLMKKTDLQLASLRGILHVRAQYCYKNGHYDEAFKLYHYLSKHNSNGTDNKLELECNEIVPLTVKSSLADGMDITIPSKDSSFSYDLLFNESMVLTAKGQLRESVDLLHKALEMASAEGYENDINAIKLQLAYVYQISGENKKSKELIDSLLETLTPGTPLYLIATNNRKAFHDYSKYSTNFNLLMRELDVEKVTSLALKDFTKEQWNIFKNNIMFLRLFNDNNIQPGSSILSNTLNNYHKLINNISLEEYKTQAKKLYHKAVTMVESGVEGSVIGFVLLAVQLLVVEKQLDNAIRLCETFLNKSWDLTPNALYQKHKIIIYILFELYKVSGRNNSKSILLKKLQTVRTKDKVSESIEFWKHVGFQYLTLGKNEEAKEVLQSLDYEDDVIKTVLKEGTFDLSKSARLVENIDVNELLQLSVSPFESNKKSSANDNANKVTKSKRKTEKKKRKELKLRKFLATHETTDKVDPERWLPLKDRTSYRPKKKQLAKQTQGGAMSKKTERSLDITKKTAKTKKNKKSRK